MLNFLCKAKKRRCRNVNLQSLVQYNLIIIFFIVLKPICANSGSIIYDPVFIENNLLKIYVDTNFGTIEVLDKNAKYSWKQPCLQKTKICILNQSFNTITFHRIFVDAHQKEFEGSIKLVLPPNKKELHISFTIDDLSQKIADFNFIEPFAAPENENSYLILTHYSNGNIYSTDIDSWPLYNMDYYSVDMMQMPWIGVFDMKTGVGYNLIVDTPNDAILKCIKFGRRRAPLIAWRPELGRFGYERKIIYNFCDSGGYVALSKLYRKYLEEKGAIIKLEEKKEKNPEIAKLYGAPLIWDYFNNIDPLEAQTLGVKNAIHHVSRWGHIENKYMGQRDSEVLEKNKQIGWLAEEYEVYADAYACDSNYSEPDCLHDIYPDNFVKDQTGKTIKGWYDKKGQQYKRCSSFYIDRASTDLNKRLKEWPVNCLYLDVTPQVQLFECWDRDHLKTRTECLEDFKTLLKYISDDKQLVLTGETGKWWTIPFISEPLGLLSVLERPWMNQERPLYYRQTDFNCDGKNETTDEAWSKYETWGSLGHKNRVPLWELVFHDCAINNWYAHSSTDWTVKAERKSQGRTFPFSYQRKKDAITILYGGVPTFTEVVWYGDEAKDQAGAWTWYRADFLTSYRNACKLHEIIAEAQMLSHEFVTYDRDVQKTTWSNGMVIYVNFSADKEYNARMPDGSEYALKEFDFCAKNANGIVISRSWSDIFKKDLTRIKIPGYYFEDCWGASVALNLKNEKYIRLNADYIDKSIKFQFSPLNVCQKWNFDSTKIFLCSNKNGKRLKEIGYKIEKKNILVGPFNDWVVLDVLCE